MRVDVEARTGQKISIRLDHNSARMIVLENLLLREVHAVARSVISGNANMDKLKEVVTRFDEHCNNDSNVL